MANVQLFGPLKWRGDAALAPGKSVAISTDVLVHQEPHASANLVFVVSARAERTGPHVFAVGIRDVSVVTNVPPGGYNLNFLLVNTHANQPLESALISVAAIS